MSAATTNEEQIRSLIEAWAQAVEARDLDKISAYHTDDILMFDVPIVQLRGLDNYRGSWQSMFPWLGENAIFTLKDLEVTAGEDVGYATARVVCAGTELQQKGEALDVRLTIGLKKVEGSWLIAHEHHSEVSAD